MKTFASLVLACALLACAQPHPTPADAGPRADVAAPSPPSPTVGARPHRSPQRPHHPVVAPPRPDPRTPAQLAQAACQEGGTTGFPISGSPPAYGAAQTVTGANIDTFGSLVIPSAGTGNYKGT